MIGGATTIAAWEDTGFTAFLQTDATAATAQISKAERQCIAMTSATMAVSSKAYLTSGVCDTGTNNGAHAINLQTRVSDTEESSGMEPRTAASDGAPAGYEPKYVAMVDAQWL